MSSEKERSVWKNVLAVTGSIGCGKSSVMRLLEQRGYVCASADQISRSLLEAGTETYAAVVSHFGPGVAGVHGSIDRKALGRMVFSDPARRKVLEEILHPAIERRALEFFSDQLARNNFKLAYEVPLLFEAGLEKRGFGRILLVTAAQEVRIERIMERDGLSAEEVLKRMRAQLPEEIKIPQSDVVIDNSSDLASLAAQLDAEGL